MSTPLEVALASAEYWVYAVRFNNALVLVAYTTLYYDYLLTFSDEVEYFWKSASLSIISVLFVVNRYLGLLGPLPLLTEYFANLPEHTYVDVHHTYHQAYALASQGIVAVMLVIRTYALYNRSRRILYLLVGTHVSGALVCLVAVLLSVSPVNTITPLPFTYAACDLSLTNNQANHLVIAWSAMLWFDTTIFTLTLVQALRMRRHFPGGLLEVMFRDGTVYYGFMVASNVSNIITFLITRTNSPLKGMDTTLTNVLSTTLTSRIILNLRNPELQKPRQSQGDDLTSIWYTTTAAPVTTATTTTNTTTYGCALTDADTLPAETQISEVDRV
ncbi:hypothetical protein C2E23DRAFT_881512 [Lenzites betulinus]|nr:hypothetical protein C2E23DRAFT_881512 [Lenzites betulinus]